MPCTQCPRPAYQRMLGKDLKPGMQFYNQGHIFQIDNVTYDTFWENKSHPGLHRYAVDCHWCGHDNDPGQGYHRMTSSLREDLPWSVLITTVPDLSQPAS